MGERCQIRIENFSTGEQCERAGSRLSMKELTFEACDVEIWVSANNPAISHNLSTIISNIMRYHYAFEAVGLLQQSTEQLQAVIEYDEQRSSTAATHHVSTSSLYDMKEALVLVEQALYCFFVILIEDERASAAREAGKLPDCCIDLASSADTLRSMILDERQEQQRASLGSVNAQHHSSNPHIYYTSRSVTDSLLFRLIVVLQLCLVRIEDARLVICGSRFWWLPPGSSTQSSPSSSYLLAWGIPTLLNGVAGSFGLAASVLVLNGHRPMLLLSDRMESRLAASRGWILPIAKASVSIVAVQWVHRQWGQMLTSTKLTNSTESLAAWCRQWELFMDHKTRVRPRSRSPVRDEPHRQQRIEESAAVDCARNQRLIEYVLHDTPKVRPLVFATIAHSLSIPSVDGLLAFTRRASILDDQTSHGRLLRFRRHSNRHYGTRYH
jgi:hypothetical protein